MGETPVDAGPLWSVPDVARRLQVSRQSIYRKTSSGELEAYRVGDTGTLRIPPHAVDELLRPARERKDDQEAGSWRFTRTSSTWSWRSVLNCGG